ncbi:hypothetical protein ACFX12_044348 [Malus domestica]
MYASQSIFNFVSFLHKSKAFNVSSTMQLKGRESWLHSILLSHYNPRQYRAARGSSGELQELHLVSKECLLEFVYVALEEDPSDSNVVADFIHFCAAKKSKSVRDSFPIIPTKKRSSLRRRPNKKTCSGFSSVPIILPKKKRSLRRRAAPSLDMTSKNLKRKRLSGCESSTNNDGDEGFLLQKKQKFVDPIRGS